MESYTPRRNDSSQGGCKRPEEYVSQGRMRPGEDSRPEENGPEEYALEEYPHDLLRRGRPRSGGLEETPPEEDGRSRGF